VATSTSERLILIAVIGLGVAALAIWRARSTGGGAAPAPREAREGASATPAAATAAGGGRAAPAVATAPPAAPAAPPATERPAHSPPPQEQLAQLGEAVLMAQLRGAAATDPALAVRIAREGNRRFPDSADAPERTSILIHALSTLGEISAARGEAEHMVSHFPDSPWVREVERFSGAHRHRNIRVTDAGTIEFQ
jgi:hypothetical protein